VVTQKRFPAGQVWGVAVTLSSALAVLWPVLFNRADSFPLSTFPMFTEPRERMTLETLRGTTAAGERLRIPPEMLGTSEVLQAHRLLANAAARGRKACERLCEAVATRLRDEGRFSNVETLELRRDSFAPVAYFTEKAAPLESRILARCDVMSQATRSRDTKARSAGEQRNERGERP
jgi:hypothetical protein